MDQKLCRRSVLIVEREELIAMVLARAFEDAGAIVTACSNVETAIQLVHTGTFAAAVLDHDLFRGNKELAHLDARGIPYVLHHGLLEVHGDGSESMDVLPKPMGADALIEEVVRLVSPQR
jgi:DNA-binding response OmpR family regulator